MKKLSIVCCSFLFFFIANAQSDSIYQAFIAKAGLLHLQENYKNALAYYERAFKFKNPDALTAVADTLRVKNVKFLKSLKYWEPPLVNRNYPGYDLVMRIHLQA